MGDTPCVWRSPNTWEMEVWDALGMNLLYYHHYHVVKQFDDKASGLIGLAGIHFGQILFGKEGNGVQLQPS